MPRRENDNVTAFNWFITVSYGGFLWTIGFHVRGRDFLPSQQSVYRKASAVGQHRKEERGLTVRLLLNSPWNRCAETASRKRVLSIRLYNSRIVVNPHLARYKFIENNLRHNASLRARIQKCSNNPMIELNVNMRAGTDSFLANLE
jgi:hypothetical protein